MVRPFAAIPAAALLLLTFCASADEHGTRDEAVAMVKRVEAMFKKDGLAATLKAVSTGPTRGSMTATCIRSSTI